jgi:quercetin dioxygenase-like cupin family protein
MHKRPVVFLAPLCMLALSTVALAQEPLRPKPTVLITQPVAGLPDKEFLMISVEVPPGATSGLHTHPGDEYGTIVEGTLMVKIGKEDFKAVTVGQTFNAPQGTPMDIKNTSNQTVKVINILINEKGKPRSTPVHSDH